MPIFRVPRSALKSLFLIVFIASITRIFLGDGCLRGESYLICNQQVIGSNPIAGSLEYQRLTRFEPCHNLARRCAITLCWDHAGLSHDEIAALFRMPSRNSVAQTIRRTKAQDAQTLKVLKQTNKS